MEWSGEIHVRGTCAEWICLAVECHFHGRSDRGTVGRSVKEARGFLGDHYYHSHKHILGPRRYNLILEDRIVV
jgi:hypothetical protein